MVTGQVGEEPECHLGAARVVGAQEQHSRGPGQGFAFDAGKGAQALPGEPFGQQRQEVGDGSAAGELVVAGMQEPFDGFDPEHVGEIGLQPGRRGPQGELLIDGQVFTHVRREGGGAVGHDGLR